MTDRRMEPQRRGKGRERREVETELERAFARRLGPATMLKEREPASRSHPRAPRAYLGALSPQEELARYVEML